ncbi:MAG: tetratricopeptide repeat protein [Muribaculaceae bacterium]|nr:tetratricopeptide repeat protein [Muribaculaceae bacterium]
MESKYEDDYTRLLLTHPAEARADARLPQPSGDFKRTIEKMQKAIQLHSISKKPQKRSSSQKEKEFRARGEFNPFLHNAWLMLGRAQYLDGDFLGAATTFLYVTKHFTWLPNTVTEARLWQARCYCALDWNYEAENVLHLVKEKDLTSKQLLHLYNIVNADYFIRTRQYDEAVPFLREAAASASGSQKNRLWFLLGQIYSLLGKKQLAYEAFKKAGSGASTSYRTKFNARIKQTEVYAGSNIAGEVNSLRSMTKFERNKEFLDQIYYAIGNLYLSRKDTAEAKKNYRLAIEKSTRNGIDKALAQISLGNIYFDKGEYTEAQPCYSEAIPMLPDNFPEYRKLSLRSDVLDELALYHGNVELQDSLLRLAAMSPEERMAVCKNLADDLIKKEKEDEEAARRDEFLAKREGETSPMDKNTPATPAFSMNADKSWYFYNNMTKNAGKAEFQRRWGARKLEDDWRRRNKSSFSWESDEEIEKPDDEAMSDDKPDTPSDGNDTQTDPATDPHNPEYYLKQIPSTPSEIRTANDIVQEGLYNMALILKDKLEDYNAARIRFDELDRRYPDNIYRLDAYYNMYIMAVRENNQPLAEMMRQKILSDFPDSPYGQAMANPEYFNNLRKMQERQEERYADAYKAYLDDNNTEVHSLTNKMEEEYPLSPILPKFVFIDALSYLTEGDNSKFRDRLTELLQKWPDTDMTDMASAIIKGLNAGKKPHAGLSNAKGMLWETRLSDNLPEETEDGMPANFERDPDAPHYLVLAFPLDSVNPNAVLYDIARFNFSSFVVKDFDLEPMRFSNIGLLVVKGFANLRELQNYRTVMEKGDIRLPREVRPVLISKYNFELLLREGRSFEEYFRFQEDDAKEKAEEDLLGPDRTMPSPPQQDDAGKETDTEDVPLEEFTPSALQISKD